MGPPEVPAEGLNFPPNPGFLAGKTPPRRMAFKPEAWKVQGRGPPIVEQWATPKRWPPWNPFPLGKGNQRRENKGKNRERRIPRKSSGKATLEVLWRAWGRNLPLGTRSRWFQSLAPVGPRVNGNHSEAPLRERVPGFSSEGYQSPPHLGGPPKKAFPG